MRTPLLSPPRSNATSKGVVLVGAAGNEGQATQVWPTAYRSVIGVGSTNSSLPLIRSAFSKLRDTHGGACGPGRRRYYAVTGGHYAQVWGTSFSTPLVAGGAALMIDINSKATPDVTTQEIEQADYIGQELGFGALDLYKAALYASAKNK